MKKMIVGALAATTMMVAAAPAMAAITVNDAETTVTYAAPSGSELDFSFGYQETGLANPFTAVLDFTNTLAGLYSFTLSTSNSGVDFTTAEISGASGVIASLVRQVNGNNNEYWDLEGLSLDAGNYVLTITGSNTGGESSALAGTVHFAAVPEPATWGMMILGFGLLGGLMRRREREVRVRYNFA